MRILRSLVFLVLLVFTLPAWAANRYWVRNGGNWNDWANHWSLTSGGSPGASWPGSTENAIFDANSFSLPGQTVTVNITGYCADLNFANVTNSPTFTSGVNQIDVYGSFTLAAGMTYNAYTVLAGTTNGLTIRTNGVDPCPLSMYQNLVVAPTGSGNYSLLDNLTASGGVEFANQVSTGGHAITLGRYLYIDYGATGIVFGSSTVTAYGINCDSTATISAASATFNVSHDFVGGGKTYGTVNLTGTAAATVYGSNTFTTLATTTQPKTVSFDAGTTQTVTNFNVSGTAGNLITLRQVGASGTWTLSKSSGIVSRDYLAIQNSIATGGASWSAGAHSTDNGGNTGWIFSALAPSYWVGDSGNWSDATNHWATSSGGAPGGGNVPTSTKDAIFDANSFSAAGKIVTLDTAGAAKSVTWTGALYSPTFVAGSGSSLTIYGTLTYIAAMSTTGNFSLNFYGNAASGLTTAGHALYSATFGDGTSTGTWTLYDALATATITTGGSATLNTNGQAVTLSGALTAGASTSLTFGASTITAAGFSFGSATVSAASAALACVNAAGCSLTTSGGLVAAAVTFSGATGAGNRHVLSGSNTLGTLSVSGDDAYLNVTAGTTQTLGSGGLVTNAIGGHLTYIQSTSPGSAWNLSKPSGTVSVPRVYLKDSHASGGAQWFAGLGSVDAGGNTGWQFLGASAPFFGSVF